MGLLDWVFSAVKADEAADICSRTFPQVWSSFVGASAGSKLEGVPTSEQHHPVQELPTVVPAAERLIAIGDIHGDFPKAQRAFRLAGLINENGNWVGGSTVCVQVGDILDRGDHELQILVFLERLQKEAEAAGGKLYVLNGNHETMNIMGDIRYATGGANREVAAWQMWHDFNSLMKKHCQCDHEDPVAARQAAVAEASTSGSSRMLTKPFGFHRQLALQPGSPITRRFFANHPTVLQVGSTVFAHGGILPAHVEYGLENINKETQAWMLGDQPNKPPAFLRGRTAIVWARDYSAEDHDRCDCAKLQSVLQSIPQAERMVVGHTIQGMGINSACGERVYRVDVGLSRGCGDGPVEVLEILNDQQVRRLREDDVPVEMSSSHTSPGPETLRQMMQRVFATAAGGA